MKSKVIELLALIIGIAVLVFKSKLANLIVYHQNKFWGFRFGQKSIKGTEIILIISGFILIFFSFLIGFFAKNK